MQIQAKADVYYIPWQLKDLVNKLLKAETHFMIFSGHAVTPSTSNAKNASSNTGNQLYHGYIITAVVLPAFYALRTF